MPKQYFYILSETKCIAKPTSGFGFDSWEKHLSDNSSVIIESSTNSYNLLQSFFNIFNREFDNKAKLTVTEFGNFTAKFKEIPPPIPKEYVVALFGIVASAVVGWSLPSIITWITSRRNIKKLNSYHKQINIVYNDGKLDENDVKSLDNIQKNIINEYSLGHLNNEHYINLKNEISILYEEIFSKRIDDLNDALDNNENLNKIKEIKNNINDAFSKEKINEKHYNLLKDFRIEKEIINKNKNKISRALIRKF